MAIFTSKRRYLVATLASVITLSAVLLWKTTSDEVVENPSFDRTAANIQRGAYLTTLGNCAACHTTRGGQTYSGGRAIETPFGQVISSNISSDKATGIGAWSSNDFWRALRHGKSKDGRLLYPAFPYENYSLVTRQDSDAMFAYLSSLPAIEQENQAHRLRFPYNTQWALAVWRAVGFRPQTSVDDASQSATWNRGSYLVNGLAHCTACHSERSRFGTITSAGEFRGGLIESNKWYAPSLLDVKEASVSQWEISEIAKWLKTGASAHASAQGPMAELVFRSTQYLRDDDATAMATYLKSLPNFTAQPKAMPKAQLVRGPKLYDQHCAQCHGDNGQGRNNSDGTHAYPALAGNRAVSLPYANNLIQIVLSGGFAPSTPGNPAPYGMPPFRQALTDSEIADIISFIRQSWGNSGSYVSDTEVQRAR